VAMPGRGKSSSRGSGSRGTGGSRPYERTARVNESMREVIAEELEEIDDDRLNMVTVTSIDVDPDFRHGVVYYSALFTGSDPEEVREAFDEHRVRVQGAIGRQIRLKRTPLLAFRPDPAITEGIKMDSIIKNLPAIEPQPEPSVETSTD
jgi:ribosome-binding factor A